MVLVAKFLDVGIYRKPAVAVLAGVDTDVSLNDVATRATPDTTPADGATETLEETL